MVITREAILGDVLKRECALKHGAVPQRGDLATIQVLPGGARGGAAASAGDERATTLGELLRGDEQVDATTGEVDAHPVAVT